LNSAGDLKPFIDHVKLAKHYSMKDPSAIKMSLPNLPRVSNVISASSSPRRSGDGSTSSRVFSAAKELTQCKQKKPDIHSSLFKPIRVLSEALDQVFSENGDA
jgi:hypothetical protein